MSELRPHPAVYSDALLPVMAEMLQGCYYVLDPFAGTGKIFQLKKWLPETRFEGIEIEQEWKDYDKRITLGMPGLAVAQRYIRRDLYKSDLRQRMADHHEAKDGSPAHNV